MQCVHCGVVSVTTVWSYLVSCLPPRCGALWCRVCRHCVALLGVVSAATVLCIVAPFNLACPTQQHTTWAQLERSAAAKPHPAFSREL